MKIVRYSYESVTRAYELEITDEVIRNLNLTLDKRMYGQSHPTITKDMVYAVMSKKGSPEQYPELETKLPHGRGYEDLDDFICDEVSQYVWESDSDIVDGEVEEWDDEVYLDEEEKAQMK